MFKVEWTKKAVRDLEQLDKPVVTRIIKRITWFASNSDKVALEPLSGDLKGMFKLRIGDWRVIYTIKDDYALIQFVGHRRDIYEI
ncbi:MAG: type II toxin-antitoxin system RelE/ParE family toxin [Dehalococcoidia bacterium]|nr:type II toxin-antitoxin system RelE/ParE family toxin [Dehalococcoidia bacterium]